MYPDYKFQVAPIVVGTIGSVIRFSERESTKVLIPKLVIKSITGIVKICKTFLNFSDPLNIFN